MKLRRTGFSIDSKDGDIVSTLIAAVEELAGGVEVEAPGIVAASPFVSDKGQIAVGTNRKNPHTVVQAVSGIDEPAVAGHQNLGTEITAGKPGWQTGDRLPCFQSTGCGIVVEQDNRRAFLLDRIQPTSVRMKMKMSGAVSRWQRNGCVSPGVSKPFWSSNFQTKI